MKKLIVILLPVFLFSCFGESKEIQQAKQDLLWENQGQETSSWNVSSGTQNESTGTSAILPEIAPKEVSSYNINYLTDKFIDVEPIVNIQSIKDELDIKWVVNNPDIDKIVVSFKNSTSTFPEDNYTLQTFKKGEKTFLYRAYKKYHVLDTWKNIYTIDAYVWGNLISKLELEVNIVPETLPSSASTQTQSWASDYVPKSIWDENNSVFLNLPINENTYGTPIMTGESSFTYSNVSWFEVQKSDEILELTCENIWDFLKQKYSWYYWNTCRPIYQDSFSLNVLSLSGDTYKYEKHYVDKKYWFYAAALLEEWTGVTKDDLSAKNQELKDKNFEITTTTDTLFQNIVK